MGIQRITLAFQPQVSQNVDHSGDPAFSDKGKMQVYRILRIEH